MSPEFNPEPELNMFYEFGSISSEDGVNRTLIRGQEKKGEINLVHFIIASLPNGNIRYFLIKEAEEGLEEYCQEILDLTTEEDPNDFRKTDNQELHTMYLKHFEDSNLPVAMLAFGFNKLGRTVNLFSVVGMSSNTALDRFAGFAEQVLGIE